MANLLSVQSASTGATGPAPSPTVRDRNQLLSDQSTTVSGTRARYARRHLTFRVVSLAVGMAVALLGLVLPARGAAASANCINVLGRDAYWSKYQDVYASVARAGWLDNAFEASEFTVDEVPAIGSLMVWAPRFGGATWAGHVGVVEVVASDGTVIVKHENWPRGSGEHLDEFHVLPGHRFVHPRQPAPGSPDGFASYPDEASRIMAVTRGVVAAQGQDSVAPD